MKTEHPPMDPAGHKAADEARQEALEAAAFRRLIAHLQERSDVQNIELMNLAGFCRNCLGKWYHQAAVERGVSLDPEAARARIYGMPYATWKARHQRPASPEQQARFEAKAAEKPL